jgi:hypothetical protein
LGCGWIIKNPGRWLVERSGVGRWGAAGVVCGLVAWLWPRGSACVVRLVVCLRLRACVRVRARERGDEIFTAWVRRKPVVVTARGRPVPRDLPATTCGRAGLACSSPPRVGGGVEPRCNAMQRPPRAGQDSGMVAHRTRRDGIARRFGAGGVVNATRAPWYGAVAAGKCGGRVGDSGACRARGRASARGNDGIGIGRRFIRLVFSRPIGETTEGITCFSPRGRGKGLFPCRRGHRPSGRFRRAEDQLPDRRLASTKYC